MASVTMLSDAEMVDQIRSGNRLNEVIRIIYRKYYDSLSWYVMNNNGSRQDAEDVFQEVVVDFIELVRNNKFREESSVKTFLFSLNRHVWLNELKRKGRALAREEKYQHAQDREVQDISTEIIGREGREQVASFIGRLGETCQKILLLFYYHNFSIREILEKMDYENEQVVRNKKYKCLKQLEQMIAENPNLEQTLKKILHG